ncbi:MAG: ATP-binding protein [Vulcanimicrobiaceae bacterium]
MLEPPTPLVPARGSACFALQSRVGAGPGRTSGPGLRASRWVLRFGRSSSATNAPRRKTRGNVHVLTLCRRQTIGTAAIHGGFRVPYREAHRLFEELVFANATGERSELIAVLTEIPLLIVDDLGMRKLPASAAEDLLEIVTRRYERASTIITSNRPLEDWPKMFSDTPAVTAFLDRLMHHGHFLQIRGKSYRLHESSLAARPSKAKANPREKLLLPCCWGSSSSESGRF